jgi:hypothetical protein
MIIKSVLTSSPKIGARASAKNKIKEQNYYKK